MPAPDDLPRFRGGGVKGIVTAIDDSGVAQTITVQTHDGVTRSGVEVLSMHGVAANPGVGAEALLIAVEGDQTHYVALPLSLFTARFGGQGAGAACLYDAGGNRLVFPGDGTGTLTTAGLLSLLVETLLIQTAGGATIRGPVTFTDAVTFAADVTFEADVAIQGKLSVTGPVTGASFNGHE